MQCIAEDGSPHGPKTFVLWNPPLVKPNAGDSAANMSHTENRLRSRMTKCVQCLRLSGCCTSVGAC